MTIFRVPFILLSCHLTCGFFLFLAPRLQLVQDLLNPRPEDEAKKHKLKRLVQGPNSFFMVRLRPGGGGGGWHIRISSRTFSAHPFTWPGSVSAGCQVPRLRQHLYRLQPRTDCGAVRQLQPGSLQAYRRQGQAQRRCANRGEWNFQSAAASLCIFFVNPPISCFSFCLLPETGCSFRKKKMY